MNRRIFSVVAALAMLTLANVAAAQSALSQVLDLNRQGMTAYQNLELEQAQGLLERALQVAQRRNVTGAPLARTYLNLGVVAVGGFGDNGRGLQYFVQAITADPSIQLDPLTSTPEIQTVFTLARNQAGQGGGNTGGGNTGGGNTGGGNTSAGSGGGVGGNLPHQPVPEQLANTAVPVYIDAPGNPAHVYLFYRGHGMREFRRVEMQNVAGGYGYEVPCTDVFQPALEYYIVAFGRDGSPLGFAGTQNDPVSVPIVGSRTQPAPALPGRAPPEQCGDEECPPGMEGCHASSGGGGMGSTCRVDGDCGSGLVCEDDLCVTGQSGGGGGGGGGESGDAPSFFIQLGGTLGLGYAQSGMLADSYPCTEADVMNGICPAVNDANAFVPGGTEECNAEDGYYCVKVGQAGLVPVGAIRFAIGYYFLPFLGAAVWGRFQPVAGQGDFAFGLVGARLQLRVTNPAATGFDVAVHAGGGGGQVQIQPPGNGPNAPYIISGYGNISLGSTMTYRFMRNFGIMAEADFMFMVPSFMFVLDITGGVEVAF